MKEFAKTEHWFKYLASSLSQTEKKGK